METFQSLCLKSVFLGFIFLFMLLFIFLPKNIHDGKYKQAKGTKQTIISPSPHSDTTTGHILV